MKDYVLVAERPIDENKNESENLETIFWNFQDGKDFLLSNEDIKNGVKHTSMMVGDVIELNNKYSMVDRFGFKEVHGSNYKIVHS